MSTQTETGIDTRLFVGGEFVEAEEGRSFENRDPFTGEVVSEVAAGTRADAKRAVEAAAEAFAEWSQTPPPCGRASSSRPQTC
jgi:succinate-semialdehyde dehydrogenase/glutarate-semialdehyde dehydrogenase